MLEGLIKVFQNFFEDGLTHDLREIDQKMEIYRGRRDLSPEEWQEYRKLMNEESTIQIVRRFNAMRGM